MSSNITFRRRRVFWNNPIDDARTDWWCIPKVFEIDSVFWNSDRRACLAIKRGDVQWEICWVFCVESIFNLSPNWRIPPKVAESSMILTRVGLPCGCRKEDVFSFFDLNKTSSFDPKMSFRSDIIKDVMSGDFYCWKFVSWKINVW